jgi:hypothetical protein
MAQPDEAKLKELVLYIAEKSVSDPDFGATKLDKVLFFCDFLSYARLGAPITGVEYQRLPHGPAPRRLLPLQREMSADKDVVIVPVDRGYSQKRIVPLRSADLSRFTAEEVALIDSVLEMLRGHNAVAVSELSHSWSPAWQAFDDGDVIPYETVFWAAPGALGPESLDNAHRIAKEFDLLDTSGVS